MWIPAVVKEHKGWKLERANFPVLPPSQPSKPPGAGTRKNNKACVQAAQPALPAAGPSSHPGARRSPAAEPGRRSADRTARARVGGRGHAPLPWAAQRATAETGGCGRRAVSWAGAPSRCRRGPGGTAARASSPGGGSQWRTEAAASDRGRRGCSRLAHAAVPVPLRLLPFLFCAGGPPGTCQALPFFNS